MECCTSIRMSKVVLCNYLDKTRKKNVEKRGQSQSVNSVLFHLYQVHYLGSGSQEDGCV